MILRLSVVMHWLAFIVVVIALLAVSLGYLSIRMFEAERDTVFSGDKGLGAYSSFVEESITWQCRWSATPAFYREIESLADIESLSTSSLGVIIDMVECQKRSLSNDLGLTAFLSALAFAISLLLWVIQYVLSGNASLLPIKRSNKKTNT